MNERQEGYNEGMVDGLALGRIEGKRCAIEGCDAFADNVIEGVDITISPEPFRLYVCVEHHERLFATLSRFSTDLSTSPQGSVES